MIKQYLNKTDENGNTIFHLLSSNINSKDLKTLLSLIPTQEENNQYLLKQNSRGETPLHQAFGFGHNRGFDNVMARNPKKDQERITQTAKILLDGFGVGEEADKLKGDLLLQTDRHGRSPLYNMREKDNAFLIKTAIDSIGNSDEGKRQKNEIINNKYLFYKNLLESECTFGSGEVIKSILDTFGEGPEADKKRIEYIKNTGDLANTFELKNGDWAIAQAIGYNNNGTLKAILDGFGNSELGKQERVDYILKNATIVRYRTDQYCNPEIKETLLEGLGGAQNPEAIKEFFAKAKIKEPMQFMARHGTTKCFDIVSRAYEMETSKENQSSDKYAVQDNDKKFEQTTPNSQRMGDYISLKQQDPKKRMQPSVIQDEGALNLIVSNVDNKTTSLMSRRDFCDTIYSKINNFLKKNVTFIKIL